MFLDGPGYYVLLKILLMYEVCPEHRDIATMERWMSDTQAAYQEETMWDFFQRCLKNHQSVLKKHYPIPNDPTIGKMLRFKKNHV